MYLILVFAILFSDTCRSANVNKHMRLLAEMDNSIEEVSKKIGSRRVLTITAKPDAVYVHPKGSTVELTCEAVAAPAPSIHWFKNDAPVYEYDVESTELIDTNPTSMATMTSTLLVTHTDSRDEYTCLITSGSKTSRLTSTVYSLDGSEEPTERAKLFPLAPRIVVSYKMYLDTIGSNVVLPCHAKGHPRPFVTWIDNKGAVIKKNPRMRVLRSGELVISSLRWEDMGEFICHAINTFGTQKTKTFVYPAKAG